jgi:1-pyrroline-5-carboxylate dehydrogenase
MTDAGRESCVALRDPRVTTIHFTGSTATFQRLWREVGADIERYHSYGANRRRNG